MIATRLACAMALPLILAAGAARAKDAAPAADVLDTVVVEGAGRGLPAPRDAHRLLPPAAGGQVAGGAQLGILGNRDALSTPFNVTGYTSKLIADSQARSVADVAANDPSVRTIFPRSSYRDVYSIRGFNLFSYNTGLDGLYGIAPKQRYPAEFAERIEILKGPDTFLNGVSLGGSVGGAINIIPKRATDRPVSSVTLGYASDAEVGAHLDIGRRYGAGQEFGIRFNAIGRGGDLAVEDQGEGLAAAALGLDYQGERLRLFGDAGAQQQRVKAPDWTVTVAPDAAFIPVPRSTTSLSQPWAQARSRDAYGMIRAEYDLSDDWTAFGAIGLSTTETTGLYVQPTFLKANGAFTGVSASFPSDGTHYSGQAGLRGRFETGPVTHHLTLAVARWDQELKATRTVFGSFPSSIFDPIRVPRPDTSAAATLHDIHRTGTYRFGSFVIADTLGLFEERLLVTLGGRWQNVENANFAATSGARTSSYDKSKFSPAAAAVFKLTDHVSVYGNYVEALQQGTTAPSNAANYGETFAPIVSRQVEAGIKVDWGTWTSSIGLFQITQPTGITDPATRIYSQDGEQRNRGVEINVAGEPVPGFRVLGGLLLLDGRIESSAGGRYDGNLAIGAPRYQANLGLEWDAPFFAGLTLSARMIATGRQFVDVANSQAIGSWTRFDIGGRYRLERQDGKAATLRFAVENLFDNAYWAAASSGQVAGLSRGAPRTFLASTTVEF